MNHFSTSSIVSDVLFYILSLFFFFLSFFLHDWLTAALNL